MSKSSGEQYFTEDQIRERIFTHAAGFLMMRHGRYSEGFARRDEDASAPCTATTASAT